MKAVKGVRIGLVFLLMFAFFLGQFSFVNAAGALTPVTL
jgi:hypothetical protein